MCLTPNVLRQSTNEAIMGLKLTPGEHHMRSENFLWSHDTQGKYKNPCLPIKTPIYSVKYNNIKIETLPLASLITLTKGFLHHPWIGISVSNYVSLHLNMLGGISGNVCACMDANIYPRFVSSLLLRFLVSTVCLVCINIFVCMCMCVFAHEFA